MSKMSQKIVIPKGLINPNETTIIEIPEEIQNVETVIAKPLYENVEPINFHEPYPEGGDYCDTYEYESNTIPNNDVGIEDIEYCDSVFEENVEYLPCVNYTNYRNFIRACPKNYINPIYSNLQAKPFIKSSRCLVPSNTKLWKHMTLECDLVNSVCQNVSNKKSMKSNLSTKDIVSILDAMDQSEFYKLENNLRNYQLARRTLLLETSRVNTIEDMKQQFKFFK